MVLEIVRIGGHEAGDLDRDGIRWVRIVERPRTASSSRERNCGFGSTVSIMAYLVEEGDRAVK